MEKQETINAFNAWMKRYIEHPEEFNREFQDVINFLEDENKGIPPTYGEKCWAYLEKLIKEQSTKEVPQN